MAYFGRCSFFFFNDTATTEIYTLSLHDALPICRLAATLRWTREVCQLARALWVHLWSHGYTYELVETHELALSAAEALGDEAAVATAHNYLASGYGRQ